MRRYEEIMPRFLGPLVSVVTPVYNGEETLGECIESVLEQTYGNFEYILVDNCSTDATARIIDDYVRREPRIRAFRNGRLVSAMENHQIAFGHMAAESRYCKVVQADDWIFPDASSAWWRSPKRIRRSRWSARIGSRRITSRSMVFRTRARWFAAARSADWRCSARSTSSERRRRSCSGRT